LKVPGRAFARYLLLAIHALVNARRAVARFAPLSRRRVDYLAAGAAMGADVRAGPLWLKTGGGALNLLRISGRQQQKQLRRALFFTPPLKSPPPGGNNHSRGERG